MHESTNLNAGQTGGREPEMGECPEAELRGVYASLRAIGARERAASDAGLESRLMRAGVGAALEPMAARVGELAARERAGLAAETELRMARASMQAVARAAGKPAHPHPHELAVVVVRRWWASPALRLAAALALVATGVVAFRLTRDGRGVDQNAVPKVANNNSGNSPDPRGEPERTHETLASQGMDLSEHELLALDGGSAELAPEFGEELDAILVDTSRLDESLHTNPWVDLTDGAMR